MNKTETVQYETPLTGATIVVDNKTTALLINPLGALVALTITFPSTNLFDGQVLSISTSQAITTVTLNGGTIINALSTLILGGFGKYIYYGGNWYRVA